MTEQEKKDWEIKETEKAYKFYKHQISTGLIKQDVLNQVESSYGVIIRDSVEKLI